jgi:hypothetical protein
MTAPLQQAKSVSLAQHQLVGFVPQIGERLAFVFGDRAAAVLFENEIVGQFIQIGLVKMQRVMTRLAQIVYGYGRNGHVRHKSHVAVGMRSSTVSSGGHAA